MPRKCAANSIITHDNRLTILLSSHYYEEDEKTTLDITPLPFNITNSKTTFSTNRAIHTQRTSHRLKHTFAMHQLHHGAKIAEPNELLGHYSMVLTPVDRKLDACQQHNEYSKVHLLYKTQSITIGE